MEDEGLEKLLIHNFIKKDPNNVKFFFKYITGRIDIKNIGSSENSLSILENSDEDCVVNTPEWFKTDEGIGWTFQSKKGELDLKIKMVKEGKLRIWMRNIDFRDRINRRLRIYIDFTKLSVNGVEVFNTPMTVWHDTPYIFTKMKVEDGEIIDLHFEWEPLK